MSADLLQRWRLHNHAIIFVNTVHFQDPVTHTFKYKSGDSVVTVHLTDTPGMNDTDGDKQDDINITKICAHLETLP